MGSKHEDFSLVSMTSTQLRHYGMYLLLLPVKRLQVSFARTFTTADPPRVESSATNGAVRDLFDDAPSATATAQPRSGNKRLGITVKFI